MGAEKHWYIALPHFWWCTLTSPHLSVSLHLDACTRAWVYKCVLQNSDEVEALTSHERSLTTPVSALKAGHLGPVTSSTFIVYY